MSAPEPDLSAETLSEGDPAIAGVGDHPFVATISGPPGPYDRAIGHALLREGQFSQRFLELEEDEVPDAYGRACSSDGKEARILDNFSFYDENG